MACIQQFARRGDVGRDTLATGLVLTIYSYYLWHVLTSSVLAISAGRARIDYSLCQDTTVPTRLKLCSQTEKDFQCWTQNHNFRIRTTCEPFTYVIVLQLAELASGTPGMAPLADVMLCLIPDTPIQKYLERLEPSFHT